MTGRKMFEFSVASDHASLAGHFPGNPVVPGVVIIDHVIEGLKHSEFAADSISISSAKFLRPLKPGVLVTVNIETTNKDLLKITCNSYEGQIASLQMRIQQVNE